MEGATISGRQAAKVILENANNFVVRSPVTTA
jgi:hypothetical protein